MKRRLRHGLVGGDARCGRCRQAKTTTLRAARWPRCGCRTDLSCSGQCRSLPAQPQVAERKQRDQLRGVLRQTPVTHPGMAKNAAW